MRSITQDDGHLFCRVDQIMQEVGTIVEIIKKFYSTLGMINDYRVRLSVRGPEGKYLGSDEVWEKAEGALRAACEKFDLPFKIGIDEAAFYGPKLDFMFKDAIGRERQLATIQCDFNLPVRFDLSFTNEQGEKERPVVIHRAISGSLERFMGVMIEHSHFGLHQSKSRLFLLLKNSMIMHSNSNLSSISLTLGQKLMTDQILSQRKSVMLNL